MNKISAGEYSNLMRGTKTLHSDSISLINEYIKTVNSIIAKDGGMNDTLITSRISSITQRIEGEILTNLSDAFSEGEEAEELLAREINEADEKGEVNSVWQR